MLIPISTAVSLNSGYNFLCMTVFLHTPFLWVCIYLTWGELEEKNQQLFNLFKRDFLPATFCALKKLKKPMAFLVLSCLCFPLVYPCWFVCALYQLPFSKIFFNKRKEDVKKRNLWICFCFVNKFIYIIFFWFHIWEISHMSDIIWYLSFSLSLWILEPI